MSEYQYYEFLAIDRPLTPDEMSQLRAISTRGQITPVSYCNEYHWGDFKGSPDKLMQSLFDAHVYVAIWGTAVFMVRLPIDALPRQTAEAMSMPYCLHFRATKSHWVITWSLEESENYDRFGMDDGRGWMSQLTPLRDELLRGDIRSLYIGWLAGVAAQMAEDDELEPAPLSGLGSLTPAQKALASFLEIDQDLLAGAGMGSPQRQNDGFSHKERDAWIASLPPDDVTAVLKQLLDGKGQQAERTLKNRFSAWRRSMQGDLAEAPRRTVGELRKNAKVAEQSRLEMQRRNRKQQEARRRKERSAYLKKLSENSLEAWKGAHHAIERGSGQGYDEARHMLVDLSEAYSLYMSSDAFENALSTFMAPHLRRKALIKRLVKAGIWDDE